MDFRNKVLYQIYPKSFRDSNGDGIGDLGGVIEKLDYLQALGVDYLWLTPFFVSPQRDNGYDVADYYAIDPIFGTMQDVERLIAGAKQRGMGIMLDMVFNHTSTEHEWFQRALAGEKEYQDYYIFREGVPDQPPTNWLSKFGGSAWEYVPGLGKWYLHLFDRTQADLNWENPKVREALKKIIRFWKKKGISEHIPWIPLANDWQQVNAAQEVGDQYSVFSWYQSLIRLRHERAVIAAGRIAFLSGENPAILAFRRYDEGQDLVVFCNFSADIVPVAGNWQDYHLLLDSYDKGLVESTKLILRPYEGVVLEQVVSQQPVS